MAHLLITGGAGFIGSHTCVVLLAAGHKLLVLDDYSNSSPVALERAQELGGGSIDCVRGDIRDLKLLNGLFDNAKADRTPIDAVIHFAGLKAVGESMTNPLRYWDVNGCGSRALLGHGRSPLQDAGLSSSATLYGYLDTVPIPESAPIQPINPTAKARPLWSNRRDLPAVHRSNGKLRVCGTSIQWGPILRDKSEKTNWGPKQPFLLCQVAIANDPSCQYLGVTGLPRMVPASATTST